LSSCAPAYYRGDGGVVMLVREASDGHVRASSPTATTATATACSRAYTRVRATPKPRRRHRDSYARHKCRHCSNHHRSHHHQHRHNHLSPTHQAVESPLQPRSRCFVNRALALVALAKRAPPRRPRPLLLPVYRHTCAWSVHDPVSAEPPHQPSPPSRASAPVGPPSRPSEWEQRHENRCAHMLWVTTQLCGACIDASSTPGPPSSGRAPPHLPIITTPKEHIVIEPCCQAPILHAHIHTQARMLARTQTHTHPHSHTHTHTHPHACIDTGTDTSAWMCAGRIKRSHARIRTHATKTHVHRSMAGVRNAVLDIARCLARRTV
jgi:hypothetical protein